MTNPIAAVIDALSPNEPTLRAETGRCDAPPRDEPGRRRTPLYLLGIVLLSLLVVWPMWQHGSNITVDGNLHIARMISLDQELAGGQFPVRWSGRENQGFGYPVFSYYQPLGYYLGVGLHHLGLPYAIALKLMVSLSFTIAGMTMFLLARRWWGRNGALAAAVIFMFAPPLIDSAYRFADVGEMQAMSLWPAVVWAVDKTARDRRWRWVFVLALLTAMVFMAHNFIALMALLTVGAYVAVLVWQRRTWRVAARPALGVAWGFALAAFFLVPAVLEMGYLRPPNRQALLGSQRTILQFLQPVWGFGLPGSKRIFPGASLGITSLVIAAFALALPLLGVQRISRWQLTHLAFGLVGFLAAFLLLSPLFGWMWVVLPFLTRGQFTARALLPASFFAALLIGGLVSWQRPGRWVLSSALAGGGLVAALAGRSWEAAVAFAGVAVITWFLPARWTTRALVPTVLAFAVVVGISFAWPAGWQPSSDKAFLRNAALVNGIADYGAVAMPKWVQPPTPGGVPLEKPPGMPPANVPLGAASVQVEQYYSEYQEYRVVVPTCAELAATDHPCPPGTTQNKALIQFNTVYWPGWKMRLISGAPVNFDIHPQLGTMLTTLEPGTYDIVLELENTWPRTLGNWTTLVSLAALLAAVIWTGTRALRRHARQPERRPAARPRAGGSPGGRHSGPWREASGRGHERPLR